MASAQARRDTTTTKEKHRVPKTKDSDVHHKKQIREGISAAVDEAEKRKGVVEKPGGKSDKETKGISFDEILKHRQPANQNSNEAKKEGEERHAKGKGMHVSEKAGDVAEKGQSAAQFAGEKAANVAGYAKKLAENVKDTAKVGGFGAVEFTMEKTAEATKGVTDVVANVAGYAGEKGVQAKDAVASGAEKVANFAGDKTAAARDVVVSSQKSAAEYAGRKKEEAQNEAGYKNQGEIHGEGEDRPEQGMQHHRGEVPQEINEIETTQETGSMLGGITRTMASPGENAQKQIRGQEHQEGGGGGVLRAIGETILEIGQTTKELLVGRGR